MPALDPYTWDMTTVDTFEVLTLTDEARNVVLDALNAEEHSETLALYVEVTGTRGAGYAYDLYFSDRADAPEGAAIGSDGGVTIVVPLKSVERLRGSRRHLLFPFGPFGVQDLNRDR